MSPLKTYFIIQTMSGSTIFVSTSVVASSDDIVASSDVPQNPATSSWWWNDGEDQTTAIDDVPMTVEEWASSFLPKEVPDESKKEDSSPRVIIVRPYRKLVGEIYDALLYKKAAIFGYASAFGANASRSKFSPDEEFGNLSEFLWKAVKYFGVNEQTDTLPVLKAERFKIKANLATLMDTLENMDIDVQPEKALSFIADAEKLEIRLAKLEKRIISLEEYGQKRKNKTSLFDKIMHAKEIIRGPNGHELANEFATVRRERNASKVANTITAIITKAPVVPIIPVTPVVPIVPSVPTASVNGLSNAPSATKQGVVPVALPAAVPATVPVAAPAKKTLASLMGKKVGKK